MGARPRALRHLATGLTCLTAALLLFACGPATPEDLFDEAEAAFQRQDATETELLLQRLLAAQEVDEALEVQARFLRAMNFIMLLNDMEQGRAELETVIDMAGINSDAGLMAAMRLSESVLLTEGYENYRELMRGFAQDVDPFSRRALDITVHQWQVLTRVGASEEMIALYPETIAQIASTEGLVEAERRGLDLDLTRLRIDLARRHEDPESAISLFEDFIGRYPGSDPALFMPFEIAALHRELGHEEMAQEIADEAFAVYNERFTAATTSAEQATVVLIRGDAQMLLGNLEAAEAEYNTIFNSYLDYQFRPRAMLVWINSLLRQDRLDDATDLATRLALEYPNTEYYRAADGLLRQIESFRAAAAAAEAAAEPASPETVAQPATPEVTAEAPSPEPAAEAASPEAVL